MVTDTFDLTHVRVPLGVLLEMTEAQRDRLRVLVDGFHPAHVTLLRDLWMPGAVLFDLLDSSDGHICNGLIEASGEAHT